MAGGVFESYNKVLPGLYYNVITLSKSNPETGALGTVVMPMPLKWGEGFIEVSAEDVNDNSVFRKIGIKNTDPEIKLIAQALQYCGKVLVYNTATGGAKATATIGDITATAVSNGTLGNEIVVSIIESKIARNKIYEVVTTVDADVVDKQKVSEYSELKSNDYVVFSSTEDAPTLSANAGITLTGGTDGVASTDYYTEFLSKLKTEKWNVLAGIGAKETEKSAIVKLIKELREDYGFNVQAVIHDYEDADYEGIIVTKQGFSGANIEITPEEFPVIVAGLTASANMFISNTMKKIKGAKKIINEMSEKEIIEYIKKGFFMLGRNVDDEVVCSKDINSFVSFTDKKNQDMSKNKILRVIYEIIQRIRRIFELEIAGQVANTESNRQLFKSKIVLKLSELNDRALEDFKPEDVNVSKEGKEGWAVDLGILPVDATEIIYLRVVVM